MGPITHRGRARHPSSASPVHDDGGPDRREPVDIGRVPGWKPHASMGWGMGGNVPFVQGVAAVEVRRVGDPRLVRRDQSLSTLRSIRYAPVGVSKPRLPGPSSVRDVQRGVARLKFLPPSQGPWHHAQPSPCGHAVTMRPQFGAKRSPIVGGGRQIQPNTHGRSCIAMQAWMRNEMTKTRFP
jgi:hypothetical protein